MRDERELLHLPGRTDISIVTAKSSNALFARGRSDLTTILAGRRDPAYLALVRIKRSWGLIDKTGKYVVEPIYGDIREFSSGLAAFSLSTEPRLYADPLENLFNSDLGLWGYFDGTGTAAIDPMFERARVFREGLAGVALGGKWGFIRKDGEFAIHPRFEGVSDFKDGLAPARFGNKCGFISQSGEISIEPRFDLVQAFSEGLAGAKLSGKCGYIDKTGTFVIPPLFDSVSDFRFGVAIVGKAGRECLIDKDGQTIFQCAELGESIGDFTDGIARVTESGGYWDHGYFIDAEGNRVLADGSEHSEAFDAAGDFSEGLGVVGVSMAHFGSGRRAALHRYADRQGSARFFGYVDGQGEIAIEPDFYSAMPFKCGMAVVDPVGDGKYGFIDSTGRVVIDAQFAAATDFTNGLARVRDYTGERKKWGFIDQTGEIAIRCQFDPLDCVEDFQAISE